MFKVTAISDDEPSVYNTSHYHFPNAEESLGHLLYALVTERGGIGIFEIELVHE